MCRRHIRQTGLRGRSRSPPTARRSRPRLWRRGCMTGAICCRPISPISSVTDVRSMWLRNFVAQAQCRQAYGCINTRGAWNMSLPRTMARGRCMTSSSRCRAGGARVHALSGIFRRSIPYLHIWRTALHCLPEEANSRRRQECALSR